MDLFFKQAVPYHRTLALIHQHRHIYYHYSRREKLHHFRYFIVVISINAIQHGICSIFPPTSMLWKVCLVDILQIGGLPPISNLLLVLSLLLGGYFIYLNYFDSEHYALDIVGDVIVRKRCHLFTRNKKKVLQYIADYCHRVLNLFQFFTLFIDIFIVACEYIGFQICLQLLTEYSTQVLIIAGVSWQLNILLYHGGILAFAYALIFQGTFAFALMEIIRLLLKQQQGFLERLKKVLVVKNQVKLKAKFRLAKRYRLKYVTLLVTICRSNVYAGKAFIPLMLVNCPTNAVLLVSLLTIPERMWPVTRVTLAVIMVEQFLCIFIVHSMLALLNDRLAALARWYIPAHYRVFYLGSFFWKNVNTHLTLQKLKSAFFIEQYNVADKPYGFTYYRFGHISTFNFGKYLLLYTELLLFIYKRKFMS